MPEAPAVDCFLAFFMLDVEVVEAFDVPTLGTTGLETWPSIGCFEGPGWRTNKFPTQPDDKSD